MRKIILLMAALISPPLAWADADADIAYREAVMKVVGGHMKAMGTILKGQVHTADLAYHANSMRDVSLLVPQIFPAGSGEGKTAALAAIWDEPVEFKLAMDLYVKAAAAMADAVAGPKVAGAVASPAMADVNMMARVGPAIQALGKSCKGCHDDYKSDD
ncbi:MAG: cytochrome c [SAR86 cluster bacterium]|uniref:Cytochrome c n=1 Tax=SAR86 cluster bacterium TaxID=2030880 RepID=A0A972VX34_9GAMM|nr:cytochrome c [SAR86 cluster bacterium]